MFEVCIDERFFLNVARKLYQCCKELGTALWYTGSRTGGRDEWSNGKFMFDFPCCN